MFILNTKGFSGKAIAAVIGIIFILYGYYGYFYVPQNTSFSGGPTCFLDPIIGGGQQQQFGPNVGEPCLYSLYALILGVVILIITIAVAVKYR